MGRQKVNIVKQRCKLLFSLKDKMKPERFVLEEGLGEEVYKILFVKHSPRIKMGEMNLHVYNISVLLPVSGLTSLKVAYNQQLDQAYILEG